MANNPLLKQIQFGETATPIAKTVVTVAEGSGNVLTSTFNSNKGLNVAEDYEYTIALAVDGKTITKTGQDGLATALKLSYHGLQYVIKSGETGDSPLTPEQYKALTDEEKKKYDAKEAYIGLEDKTGASVPNGEVTVASLIGSGIVEDAEYDSTTGILTINFVGENTVTIDLTALLDIDDIIIDQTTAKDYLSFTPVDPEAEQGQAVLGVKLADVTFTPATSGTSANLVATTTNGKMLDASDAIPAIKSYVDAQTTDLSISAQGDNYITAAVDSQNNKKINVTADVQDLTASAGTRGTYTVADNGTVTLTGETAPSILGVADSLVDGADVATKVKTYVDAKVAAEAAAREAYIEGAVKALDAEVGGTKPASGNNVAVKITEVDGKLTGVTVTDNTPTAISNAIKALDVTDTAVAGQYVTAVSETDGKVSITRKAIVGTEVTLTDYETTKTGANDIAATDTVNAAFKKIENKIDENERVTAGALNDLRAADTAIDAAVGLGTGHAYSNKGTYIGKKTSPETNTVTSDIKALDTAVANIASGIEGLDATVRGNLDNNDHLTTGKNVGVKVVETDGKLTDILVVDNTATAISNTINGLDAEVTSTNGTNVQVKVTEVDGKITAVNVTTDNTVNATDVSNAIKALDATVGSTSVASGEHVAVQVVETDGKLTGLTVTEDDIASASDVNEIATKVGLGGTAGARTFTPTTNYGTGTTSVVANMQAIDTQLKAVSEATAAIQYQVSGTTLQFFGMSERNAS